MLFPMAAIGTTLHGLEGIPVIKGEVPARARTSHFSIDPILGVVALPGAAMVNGANHRPSLLYVSAVAPDVTGSGSAMRAGAMLRALARAYRVTLLLTAARGQQAWPIPDAIAAHCERVVRWSSVSRDLSRWERFDAVHLFRLEALADAAPWLRWATRRQIDLDDPASLGAQRVATLARAENRVETAERATATAEAARQHEDDAISRFDQIFVSSEVSRQGLLRRHASDTPIAVLPNSLPLPESTPVAPPQRGPFVLLLAGTVGIETHDDAVHHFCGSILPRIQAGADRPVTLRVVGAGESPTVARLGGQAGVEVIGEVADMAASYRDAHVAVVPLRAGGAHDSGCWRHSPSSARSCRPLPAWKASPPAMGNTPSSRTIPCASPTTCSACCAIPPWPRGRRIPPSNFSRSATPRKSWRPSSPPPLIFTAETPFPEFPAGGFATDRAASRGTV